MLRRIWNNTAFRILTPVALAGVAAYVYLSIWNPSQLTIQQYDVDVAADFQDPLRIVSLADIHLGGCFSGMDRLQEIVNRTNAQDPDLVLIPGDLVLENYAGKNFPFPGRAIEIAEYDYEAIAKLLSKIRAPTVFSLGNHEYIYETQGGNKGDLIHTLKNHGIAVLINDAKAISIKGQEIWVVAFDDSYLGNIDVLKAFKNVPQGAKTLLMSHNPDGFAYVEQTDDVPQLKDILQGFAGDTHCGQVFEGFGKIFAEHVQTRDRDWFCGIASMRVKTAERGSVPTHTSAGIGTSHACLRAGPPSEISVFNLH